MDDSANKTDNGLVERFFSVMRGPLRLLKTALLERGMRGKTRHMMLVESLSLGNRRQLFLVSCDGQRFLVGAGKDGVGTLVAMPQPEAARVGDHSPTQVRTGSHRPLWMGDRSLKTEGTPKLQLVKRGLDSGDSGMEASRTQW